MIRGFGGSIPAMANTRTLASDNERSATLRVIPFFSCGAKLPILTAISGGIVMVFNVGNAELITYSMYVLGMAAAVISLLIMRNTTMRGENAPFIMELPSYHAPRFQSLMIHLWDKLKHYVQKAFTIILASCIVIWFLSNFGWNWQMADGMENSILASLGKFFQPLFTPLGFGSQLGKWG
jgi:ferrous iron transport protein B